MATAVRKTNWFAIGVTIAVVVVVVAVGALVLWMNNASASPSQTPQGASINTDTGAIAVGSGPNTLDTYIDFMCPVCNQFEQVYGDALAEQVDAGTLTLNIHPISILDSRSQGTAFSSRAAGAMYCVAESDPDHAVAFMRAMYQNQPTENTAGLTDDEIVQIATSAGVTDADAVGDCITEGTFMKYAQSMTDKTPIQAGQNGIATPTLVLNGETIVNTTLTGDPQADFIAKFK